MVVVAQLVRASVCGTESRRFEPGLPPRITKLLRNEKLFLFKNLINSKLLILIVYIFSFDNLP